MRLFNFLNSKKQYSDCEIIVGLQSHNREIESYFYENLSSYFEQHFNETFFDQDSKNEVFQTALIKLWTEIENKRIRVIDGKICRKQVSGELKEMTASLTTFLMTFAKNEYREILRNVREDNLEEVINNPDLKVFPKEPGETEEELRMRLIDECIMSMSPRCIEIITLYYYKHKSLDDIMEIRSDKNTSKDGLKTAKSKCLVTLRAKIIEMFNKFNLTV